MVTMRSRVVLTAIFALTLAGAACARPPAPPPSVPGAMSTATATSLAVWLESIAPTRRLEWRDLEAGCGDQRDCQRDLAQLERALRDRCPAAAACGDPVAGMLYLERTAAQRASGLYPDALPRAANVLAAWQAALPTATPRAGAP